MVMIPRIAHIRLSQAVSSHLSNGCHLAFLVSPVNSFSDHNTSIDGSDETRCPCGSRSISELGTAVFYKDARRKLSKCSSELSINLPFFIISSCIDLFVRLPSYKRSFIACPKNNLSPGCSSPPSLGSSPPSWPDKHSLRQLRKPVRSYGPRASLLLFPRLHMC